MSSDISCAFSVPGYFGASRLTSIYLASGCAVQTICSYIVKCGIARSAKKLAKNITGRSKCYL
jgi:hypothetical protein